MTKKIALTVIAQHKQIRELGDAVIALIAKMPDLSQAETVSYNLQLVVQEIAANIVDHAYADSAETNHIKALFKGDKEKIVIVLTDKGVPFDRQATVAPDLNTVQVRGYGLFLAEALLDDIQYVRTKQGNQWTLVKKIT